MKKNKNFAVISASRERIKDKLGYFSALDRDALFYILNSGADGLSEKDAAISREKHGANVIVQAGGLSAFRRFLSAFVNPFTLILALLAAVSVLTDIVMASPEEKNYVTVVIITVMVVISGVLRFVQETRSGNAAAKLSESIRTTACVLRRDGGKREIPLSEIATGDVIMLSAGDIVPADVRIISALDLFVNQSSLTGESEPVEKRTLSEKKESVTDLDNIAFAGSTVVSGSATAVAVSVGKETLLGSVAKELVAAPEKTGFEKGVNAVSRVLVCFMLVMVPIVFLINGFTKRNWTEAFLFAISVAVGLTPEMLPMIVTAGLAKGAVAMGKKKVIVKNLNAIHNLGSADILCTDKTGTLTQNKVALEYYLDVNGNEDERVLRHAFLNSYFQTGLKNLVDEAVIARQDLSGNAELKDRYFKVDEIPFDFDRRRMSVVVSDKCGKTQLITKGAVEEMLSCCDFADMDGKVVPLSDDVRAYILDKCDGLNRQGLRVIAVAQKTNPSPVDRFSVADESEMVLIGFLAFLDPPKDTAARTVRTLSDYGVNVKILTGDNEKVTANVASRVGIDACKVLLGHQTENMSDEELAAAAETTNVFAKLAPEQKARIVRVLRQSGHTVAFMGDGINDAAAMRAADVGISVDSAVDIAKESADVILLDKDLNILEDGIIEGRKTYANMIKYIKITASSNFGNMFSVLAASAFLPFLPMTAIHLILLNLVYDVSCTALPWDNVDREYLVKPRKWDASSVSRFMLWIGPTSSLFDIATFLIMYFVICPAVAGGNFFSLTDPAAVALFTATFQAGWFIESMWSQTLVVHTIRSAKLPFVGSRASLPVAALSVCAIALITLLPFTPVASYLGLAKLPPVFFGALAVIVAGYLALATAVKSAYVKKYGELL